MTDELLTAREFADMCGVQPGTVLDWYAAGKIPSTAVVRLGGTKRGRLRFKRSAIAELLEAWSGEPVVTSETAVALRPRTVE